MVRSKTQGIGIALAGGGPLGAIYEIGALAAMADCLPGLNVNALDVYVGVSAGSVVAAGLANGFTPRQMSRLFIEGASFAHPFSPEELIPLALDEFRQRLSQLLPLVQSMSATYRTQPTSLWRAIGQLGRALPTGILSGEGIDAFLRRVFAQRGGTNDFRQLKRKLFVVATDLDNGTAVEFGRPDNAHVPISRAVQASTAVPGLFAPVRIDGRDYVDGALQKTLHASVAIEHGAKLVLCINPLVPFDATDEARARAQAFHIDRLVDGGLPVVLAQAFRTLIHSRLDAGMARYRTAYPGVDIVMFEPSRTDATVFLTNLFSYAGRRTLCEHAYQYTRASLLARRQSLSPRLARYGIRLDLDALRDPDAYLVPSELPKKQRIVQLESADTLRQLSQTLEDLSQWVHAQR
ncbi:MAG TPA: patatin-like phospholipase family protein [Burkholderiaceae bacterium]|nr:patatin-like phospholipase family protein [Burkholderiaceae bacterium]